MAKKQSTKKRTEVKDLPKKEKKLSTKDMKRVKGGHTGDGKLLGNLLTGVVGDVNRQNLSGSNTYGGVADIKDK